jgi:hypothetical protein
VRWPAAPRRGRQRALAPAAIQASCCSSVSDWLYFFEAAPKRPRQCCCLVVRGFLGRAQRRRRCLLPTTYQTQSPQRPLLTAGSRHSPEGPRNGQPRHPRLRSRPRLRTAFRSSESLPACAFIMRHSTFVITNCQLWLPIAPLIALWSQARQLTLDGYQNRLRVASVSRRIQAYLFQPVTGLPGAQRRCPARMRRARFISLF